MDQSGTDRQVQGALFRICKFMDQSGTGRQVKGPPPVYFTLLYIVCTPILVLFIWESFFIFKNNKNA